MPSLKSLINRRTRIVALSIATLSLITIEFQACTTRFKTSSTTHTQNNGDFYTGKTESYAYSDPNRKCQEVSKLGRPFPNRIIQFSSVAKVARLVRDECVDIPPADLASDQYSFSPDGGVLSYSGQAFSVQADASEFDLVPKLCPSGLSLNGVSPINQLTDALNFTRSPWAPHEGIDVSLFGTLFALPRYSVRRLNSPLEYWRGVYQTVPMLERNTYYSISFLVARGNTQGATLNVADASEAMHISAILDFTTGVVTIPYVTGYTAVSASAVSYGAGYNVTVFFNTNSTAGFHGFSIGPAVINNGVAEQFGASGDVVYVATSSLYKIASYCK